MEEAAIGQWPFEEPANLGVFTTRQLFNEGYALRLVTHDADGDWQFLCGTTSDPADGMVVCLEHVVARFPEVHELADLPRGWRAWREEAGWSREPRPAEE
jgi:hypothetical protein